MRLIELLEKRTGAMKVGEVAKVLGVSPQQIYKMAASGSIPSLRISGAIRFDPGEVADWLKKEAACRESTAIGSQAFCSSVNPAFKKSTYLEHS
jgi:excisionase family DNA binding protein